MSARLPRPLDIKQLSSKMSKLEQIDRIVGASRLLHCFCIAESLTWSLGIPASRINSIWALGTAWST